MAPLVVFPLPTPPSSMCHYYYYSSLTYGPYAKVQRGSSSSPSPRARTGRGPREFFLRLFFFSLLSLFRRRGSLGKAGAHQEEKG